MKKKIQIPVAVQTSLNDLGRAIVAARKAQGISQAELARRVGVMEATMLRIEAGDGGAAIEKYFKAMWLLGLPLPPGAEESEWQTEGAAG